MSNAHGEKTEESTLPDLLALNTILQRTPDNALNPCGSEWVLLSSGQRGQKALIVGARNPTSIQILLDRYASVEVWQFGSEKASSLTKNLKILGQSILVKSITPGQLAEQLTAAAQSYDLIVFDNCLFEMFGSESSKINDFLNLVNARLTPDGQCCVVSKIQPSILGIAPNRNKSFAYGLKQVQRATKDFAYSRTFFLYPELDEPNEIIGWSDALPAARTNIATRLLNKLGLIAPMHRAVVMVSGNKPVMPFLQQLVQHANQQIGGVAEPAVQRCFTRFNGTVIAMVNVDLKQYEALHDSGAVLRIPLNLTSETRLDHAWNGVKELCTELPWLAPITPMPLVRAEYLGMKYYLESQCQGVSAETLVNQKGARAKVHEMVLRFLRDFSGQSNPSKRLSSLEFDQHVAPYFESLRSYAPEYSGELDHLFDQIQSKLNASVMPLVRVHGDFNSGNVLCNAQSYKITAIIDWDACQSEGLPLQDLAHFLIHRYRHDQQLTIGEALIQAISDQMFDESEQDLVRRYEKMLNIDSSLRVPLLILYWLRHVSLHIQHRNGPLPAVWQENNLHLPLRHLGNMIL